jgi:putative heme iron utilization protein
VDGGISGTIKLDNISRVAFSMQIFTEKVRYSTKFTTDSH